MRSFQNNCNGATRGGDTTMIRHWKTTINCWWMRWAMKWQMRHFSSRKEEILGHVGGDGSGIKSGGIMTSSTFLALLHLLCLIVVWCRVLPRRLWSHLSSWVACYASCHPFLPPLQKDLPMLRWLIARASDRRRMREMGEGLEPLLCCINKSEILVLIKCLLPPPQLNYHSSASPFTTRPFSSTFLTMFCIPPSVPSHRQSLFPSRLIRLSRCIVPSHRVCNPPYNLQPPLLLCFPPLSCSPSLPSTLF